MKKAAVLTFINTISGQYRWWDEFPAMIGQGLGKAGVEHVCFRRDYDALSTEPPETRHPTPEGSLGDLGWLRENVRPVADRFERVIFHTHGHYQPILLGREVWHHGRARWFWTEHLIADPGRGERLKKAVRAVGQVLRLFPERLFGVSEAGAARLREQFLASSVKCIRTSVRLLPSVERTEIPQVPRRALFVGRLIPEKGIWPLLRAFILLRERNVDVTLTVVGPGGPEVQAFIDANLLQERVRLAGHRTDVAPFYRQADFVIVPSLWLEALGMVSLEARVYGLPVIYSRRGGLPETQIEGVTGLALAEVSPEAIADAVVELQSNPDRYAEMSRRARVGLEEYQIERMVDAYVGEYLNELAAL
jgi:glycosyltransferase involved in cell wall biosynthesis